MGKTTKNTPESQGREEEDVIMSAEDAYSNAEPDESHSPMRENVDVGLDEVPQERSSQMSDRAILLTALMATWIVILAGGAYMYKELRAHKVTSVKESADTDIDKLYSRIARLERGLEKRRDDPEVSRAVEQSARAVNRLQKLETIVRGLPKELPDPVQIPDNLVNQDELLVILSRVRRLEALEKEHAQLQMNKEQISSLGPLLMGIFTLRDHVMNGADYQKDLLLLKELAKEDAKLMASFHKLEQFLEGGVVTMEQLKGGFDTLAREIYRSSIGEGEGAWEKAKSLFAKAIVVRKVDEKLDGDSVEAILSRAGIYLKESQLNLVLQQLKELKGKPAIMAEPWIEKAERVGELEKIFAEIYSRATELSAELFKKQQARSPYPYSKPLAKKAAPAVEPDLAVNPIEVMPKPVKKATMLTPKLAELSEEAIDDVEETIIPVSVAQGDEIVPESSKEMILWLENRQQQRQIQALEAAITPEQPNMNTLSPELNQRPFMQEAQAQKAVELEQLTPAAGIPNGQAIDNGVLEEEMHFEMNKEREERQ